MRAYSPQWDTVLTYSHRIVSVVDAWYDGMLRMPSVPIVSGQILYDGSGHIQRSLKLSVPTRTPSLGRLDPGSDPLHPLANNGQRLHVSTGIATRAGMELLDHGWYLIEKWERNDAERQIDLTAVDLSRLVADDDFTAPATPLPSATFASEFVRLVSPHLPAQVDPRLIDRPIPATVVWEASKIDNLQKLCDAWPARWYVNDGGTAFATILYPDITEATTPDYVLTDGASGTIIDRARGADRGAIFNSVPVQGRAVDGSTEIPYAVAEIIDPASPIRVGGPYGRNVRPVFKSDLITTQAQAEATANALLGRFSRRGRAEKATAIPNGAILLGDVGRLYTSDGDAHTGRTQQITLPLTVDDGAMTVTVSTLPGTETRLGRTL